MSETGRKVAQFDEATARHDLAALYRLAVHYGWTDLTSTHISARLPQDPGFYLFNSHDVLFDEICASGLVRMSFDGETDHPNRLINEAGHIIHSGVLMARPEINYVIHSHTRAGIAVSTMPQGLMPLSQHAGFVLATLATHAYQDSTAAANEGELLVRDLGDSYTMLLQNHGLLALGRTAGEAFYYHYMLEMACRIQVDALAGSAAPIEIEPGALRALLDWGSPQRGIQGEAQWQAALRLLDRTQPDYRN